MILSRAILQRLRILRSAAERIQRRVLPAVLDPGAMPWFSLTYLVFLGMPFVLGPPGGVPPGPTLLAAVAFLPLYFAFYWARGWQRAVLLLLIAALAVPLLPYNWFASAFLIYSNVLAVFLPWTHMLSVLVLSQLMWASAVYMHGLPVEFFIFMGLFTGLLSAAGNWVWVSNSRRHAALRLSQDEVRRLAVVAERERIGRDLHDLLGHTLSVVALKSELAGKLLTRDPQAASREIHEVSQVAREALAQVRSAVTGIRRMLLAAELANARLALGAARVDFHYEGTHPPLPQELETVLALVLREAVTNVIRHASAHRCECSIEVVADRVRLSLRDDGAGIGSGAEGQGLSGMRERLHALGGTLVILPATSDGTELVAELPLPVMACDSDDLAPPLHAQAHLGTL